MTWNVENLFPAGGPSGPASPDVYEAKLEGLAATINAQAPDVVGLPGASSVIVRPVSGINRIDLFNRIGNPV
jgi:hypothetical protein